MVQGITKLFTFFKNTFIPIEWTKNGIDSSYLRRERFLKMGETIEQAKNSLHSFISKTNSSISLKMKIMSRIK